MIQDVKRGSMLMKDVGSQLLKKLKPAVCTFFFPLYHSLSLSISFFISIFISFSRRCFSLFLYFFSFCGFFFFFVSPFFPFFSLLCFCLFISSLVSFLLFLCVVPRRFFKLFQRVEEIVIFFFYPLKKIFCLCAHEQCLFCKKSVIKQKEPQHGFETSK